MVRLIDFIQRNRKAVFWFVLIALLNGVLFLVGGYREIRLYRDASTVLKDTRQQVRSARRQLDEARRVARLVEGVRQRMQRFFKDDAKDLSHTLPPLTGKLFEILTANRMNFQNVTYTRKPELRGKLSRIVIHVPVKATYSDLIGLVRDLEQLPFPAMLDRISVSSVSGVEISATVDIITYYKETS